MKGITLIGMPGSGKSTIGKLLAAELGWKFVDLDEYIKKRTGKSHAEILDEIGDEKFIKLEGGLALELDFDDTVFSPGGSIVYSASVMEKIRDQSKVVYLELPLEEIRRRLGGAIDSRGIVGLKEKGIEKLFSERSEIYGKYADIVLRCEGSSENDMVRQILESYGISQHE